MTKFYLSWLLAVVFSWQLSAQSFVIGTGTEITNGKDMDPVNGNSGGNKCQIIYKASDLLAGGMKANYRLTGLGFSISEAYGGEKFLDYVIKIGHTNSSRFFENNSYDYTCNFLNNYSYTTVKEGFSYKPVATAPGEFDMITFNTKFIWNGIDNIIIEICNRGYNDYNQTIGGLRGTSDYGYDDFFQKSFSKIIYAETNQNSGPCGLKIANLGTIVPNIKFNYEPDTVPVCLPPTNIVQTYNSESEVKFSWTKAADGVTDWEYVVQAEGIGVPSAPGKAVSGTPLGTGGVNDYRKYEFYVRSVCNSGSNYSVWAGPYKFTSACFPYHLPYNESFEDWFEAAIPPCSFNENLGSGSNWIVNRNYYNSVAGVTGTYLLYIPKSTEAANTWYFTPRFELSAGKSYKLSFVYARTGASNTEKLKVMYGNSQISSQMTNQIVDYPSINNGTPKTSETIFSPTTTGVYSIGFLCYSDKAQSYLVVDDIKLEEIDPTLYSLDWVGTKWPASITIDFETGKEDVYAQVYKAGITETAGQGSNINAWVGYSKTDTDPSTWDSTDWQTATYNGSATDTGNNDEYKSTLGPKYPDNSWYISPGLYFYASKFTYNGGSPYYAGIKSDGSSGGIWDGTTFKNGKLYVTTEIKKGWVNLGVMPDATTKILAQAAVNATMYEFQITKPDNTVQTISTTNNYFTFSEVSNLQYGVNYAIKVRAKVTNGEWLPWGVSRNLSLSANTIIKPSNCGMTYPNASWQVPAVPITGAQAYTFKFDDGKTIQEVEVVGDSRTFFTAINYKYGTTYAISVKVKLNGVYGAYGDPCNITLGTPTTTIQPRNCGITYPNASWQVPAVPISGAEAYTFKFDDGTTTPEEVEVVGDTRTFFTAINYKYENTYAVSVKVKVNGVYGAYGDACNITLGIPTTTINPSNCGLTYPSTAWQVPVAPIVGAQAYTFEFNDGTTTEEVEVVGDTRTFLSALKNPPTTSKTYTIRVKVKVNGEYGSYGDPCIIYFQPTTTQPVFTTTTKNDRRQEIVFPNPFSQSFSLNIDAKSELKINIFDINERLVESHKVKAQQIIPQMGENLKTGYYLVVVQDAEGNLTNYRVVKQ